MLALALVLVCVLASTLRRTNPQILAMVGRVVRVAAAFTALVLAFVALGACLASKGQRSDGHR